MSKGKRVFIIEQERIIGLDLQQQLIDSGYTVHRPISLIETETIFRNNMPDFIIADTEIQQQSGFVKIKKQLGKLQVPIICIGIVTKETLKECDGINIIGTFSKPFESKAIITLINKHFDEKGSRITKKICQ